MEILGLGEKNLLVLLLKDAIPMIKLGKVVKY